MAPRGSYCRRVMGVAVAVAACALCLLPATTSGALRVGFYQSSCPNAEALVRQAVAAAFARDAGVAAGLIRLHFHDCFVRGCDASVLLTKNPAGGQTERDAAPNNPSLRGFEVIDAAKAAVEAACPRTVSCADIIAFAARDSVKLTGNVDYQVPAGRRDGNVSIAQDAFDNLPPFIFTAQKLAERFANKSLSLEDMVVLSGAHTVGRSFCSSFVDRVRNSTTGAAIVDAGLDPGYAAQLRALCPTRDTLATTPMDPDTPATLDNNYYKLLPQGKGLFFSDNQLRVNATMNALVTRFAANEAEWKQRFADAMVKMGHIEVQTGRCGQIRVNCNVVNPSTSSPEVELAGEDQETGGAVAAS
ncbi:peroxidase 1-like [Oryza glaberrima]|uniref:Peroxidase n=1 Tax=Oryza glaberrima TaxID=4538 RepID=I1NMP8_ORYGL|nr:peroxidase 1-like [Oryza glaberrima]